MDLAFTQRIIDELGVPQLVDVRDQLPRNKKYSWADLAGFRKFEDLDTNGLHHDAYPKKNRLNVTPMQMMAEIANEHIKNKTYDPGGEGGMPYHIYIMRGFAYYCNEISWRTYGIGNHNGHVIHICVHGDYVNYDQLTEADRNCVLAVCLMLRQVSAMPNLKLIKGHCELNPTDCPGYDYKGIRDEVSKLELKMQASSDPSQNLLRMKKAKVQHEYLFEEYEKDPIKLSWLEPYLLKMDEVTREYGMYFDK